MSQITITPPAARATTVSLTDERPVVSVTPRAESRQVLVTPAEHAQLQDNFETLAQNLRALPKVNVRDEQGCIVSQNFGDGRVIKRLVRDANRLVVAIELTGTLLGQKVWKKVFERDTSGRISGSHYTVEDAL